LRLVLPCLMFCFCLALPCLLASLALQFAICLP
jgi:hypothetical protein